MDRTKLETFAFVAFFAIISTLVVLVFLPFVQILALAAVFAILFQDAYLSVLRALRGQATIAALLVVVLVLVFCIIPIFLLGTQIFSEAQSLYLSSQSGTASYVQAVEHAIENPIRHLYPQFSFSVGDLVARSLSFLSNNLAGLVSQTLTVVLGTILMLLAFFFFLRDGEAIIRAMLSVSPFRTEHTDEIIRKTKQTIDSVIRGTLFVAIIRWFFFSLAFYLFGFQNAILWGSVAGIIGAIPGLGTPFAVIPSVVFLYFEGNTLGAIGFAVFGIAVMALVDNLLTSYFFGKSIDVPPVFIIFSLLGGVSVFGPMGFILGPLVLSLFLTMLHMYQVLFLSR